MEIKKKKSSLITYSTKGISPKDATLWSISQMLILRTDFIQGRKNDQNLDVVVEVAVGLKRLMPCKHRDSFGNQKVLR